MSVSTPPQTEPQAAAFTGIGWQGFLLWMPLVVAFGYLYASVFPLLIDDWLNDPNYSHGILVPFLSAYFVWERRQQLALITPQPSWRGLLLLLGGVAIFLLGNLGAELFLMRSSMIVVLAGLVLYLLGWSYVKVLTLPLAFLLFMIPLPAIVLNAMTLPLQFFAAKLATASLQLISLPVYREGNVIFLPHATLEVVEACSGIRSLVSLVALAIVYAYMAHRASWQRIALSVSAIPIAIIANAFRIWGTGVLAHFYGMKAADGFYHTFAGWLVFVVAFVLLGVISVLLAQFTPKHAQMKVVSS